MDRSAVARKRRQDAAQPTTKPPIRLARDKRLQQEAARRHPSGRIREAKDSSEIIRVPRKADTGNKSSLEEDSNARHFTVANVGSNGTVYLKPSRMPPTHFTQPPATPPRTSEGPGTRAAEWPIYRQSDMSGTWTPRVQPVKSAAYDHRVPVPPPSMANGHQRRRTRSHSFSTNNESVRTQTYDSTDFQFLLNGRDATRRPKSSVDLSEGLLDLAIPHYRLGTPRFSDRGTAYLHSSLYSSRTNTEDMRSSVFSRAEYDKLFPAPPARDQAPGRNVPNSSSPYLHPSSAASLTPTRTPSTPPVPNAPGNIVPEMYDRVEADVNDPSLVRYKSGRIVAATVGRLISQITSPLFLDYELLADFFLTYRNFMSPRDLLDYLLCRLQWALGNNNDAGRIVRVRTFVALRHWILNYFPDDFILDLSLRQRFCERVNELVRSLRARQDGGGGGDINVVGELKKCWRRTCVTVWPIPDSMETSPDLDISPGEGRAPSSYAASATSLPLTVRNHGSRLDFRRSSQIQLVVNLDNTDRPDARPSINGHNEHRHGRTASIPTSPMSEDSLEILSCSVPFLTYIKPAKDKTAMARPAGLQRNPPLSLQNKDPHRHKRSGSFNDALRDERSPLPSGRPASVDMSTLRSHTFTGGLVRGLLLQPSPSHVDLLIPLSPGFGNQETKPGAPDNAYFHDQNQQNAGVKRIVGDVRRALSSRRRESPVSSHRSTNSSDSHISGPLASNERQNQTNAWQQLRGTPRVDMLGERLEESYKEVFQDNFEATTGAGSTAVATQPRDSQIGPTDNVAISKDANLHRLNSHVTTGSRSIVIVDDTGPPEIPSKLGALPSPSTFTSNMTLEPPVPYAKSNGESMRTHDHQSQNLTNLGESGGPPSFEPGFHDLLTVPEAWDSSNAAGNVPSDYAQARKSSSVHPSALEIAPSRNQLRRRPGGDLKAAENVHDLEPTPRPETTGSYSTFTQSFGTSERPSNELSGTHFSGQKDHGLRLPPNLAKDVKSNPGGLLPTHSSQPNMRPSFERQVSHLAKMDDRQSNGGIEDALAKLEGKSPTSPTPSDTVATEHTHDSGMPYLSRQKPRSAPLRVMNGAFSDDSKGVDEAQLTSPRTDRQGASIYRMSGSDADSKSMVTMENHQAYDEDTRIPTDTSKVPAQDEDLEELSQRSFIVKQTVDVPETTGKSEVEHKPDSGPTSAKSQGSFLLDDNESLSDISTEIADQSGDDSLGVRSFFFDDTVDDDYSSMQPFHPPPTPPSTIEPPTNQSPERSPRQRPDVGDQQQRHVIKETASAPKLLSSHQPIADLQHVAGPLRRTVTSPAGKKKSHLPFVLAFDSDVIAEQLTIIEKDAIDEVDWKDLITLNWRQHPSHARNWVDYLKNEEPNGIDIVIARFNLMVKWVVSECVLTEAATERGKCITKYIHIAAHCHRLRNYSSMYQITLALLSTDMARLHKTWSLVAPAERQLLSRLEKLCQPLRNFHNLRTEMESNSADAGCIPFIGLYTHDLVFNAQKPARIDPTPPSGESLVNFERFQTAATIVKSLLRLIESSSKYVFHPHPEVLSRCLWLAALEDGEITAKSKALERADL